MARRHWRVFVLAPSQAPAVTVDHRLVVTEASGFQYQVVGRTVFSFSTARDQALIQVLSTVLAQLATPRRRINRPTR